MRHRADLEMERDLAALRAAPRPMDLAEGAPVAHGVYFYWDAQEGEVGARLLDEPGALGTFEVEVRAAPRWLNIALELGGAAFAEGEVLGLALQARAEAPFTTAPYLRTGGASAERSSAIGAPIEVGTAPGTFVRLLTIGWREVMGGDRPAALILPLPHRGCRFTLIDMRLFVLPAGAGVAPDLPALGNAAG